MTAGPLHIAWAIVPHVALIIGLYIFHNAWIALAIEAAILSVGLWSAYHKGWRPLWGRLGFRLTPFVALHLLAGPLLLFLWRGQDPAALKELLASVGVGPGAFPLLIVLHSVAVPVVEELFWRGVLYRSGRGLVWPDVLFALYHVLVLILFLPLILFCPALIVLAGAAWFWRQEVQRSGGIAPAVLLHAASDLSLLLSVIAVLP